jgi:hypothetical protein
MPERAFDSHEIQCSREFSEWREGDAASYSYGFITQYQVTEALTVLAPVPFPEKVNLETEAAAIDKPSNTVVMQLLRTISLSLDEVQARMPEFANVTNANSVP